MRSDLIPWRNDVAWRIFNFDNPVEDHLKNLEKMLFPSARDLESGLENIVIEEAQGERLVHVFWLTRFCIPNMIRKAT